MTFLRLQKCQGCSIKFFFSFLKQQHEVEPQKGGGRSAKEGGLCKRGGGRLRKKGGIGRLRKKRGIERLRKL